MNNNARTDTDYGRMNKEGLMRVIQQLAFVAHEAQLFLDTHPDCKMALEKFHAANDALSVATEVYTSRFGPICAFDASSERWDWVDSPWPWQICADCEGKEK